MTLFRKYDLLPGHPRFVHVAETGSVEQAQRLAIENGAGHYVLSRDHEPPRSDTDPYIAARIGVDPDGNVTITERRP